MHSRRGSFGLGLDAPPELRLDHLVSFRIHAAESIFDFDFALSQKIDENLHILIEFVRHVI